MSSDGPVEGRPQVRDRPRRTFVVPRARHGGRADWTPLVLVTATLSLTVVTAVLLLNPRLRPGVDEEPGPALARRSLAPEVVVWVGDLAPGLKGVLGTVWGETEPDAEHDATLNAQLGLGPEEALAFYRLLVFNPTEERRSLALPEGGLEILPPTEGASPVPLRSLADMLARGEAQASPALAVVLAGEGTLRREISLEPHSMADLLVAFARRVPLAEARGVAGAEGRVFVRRRMPRRQLEALMVDPGVKEVEEL